MSIFQDNVGIPKSGLKVLVSGATSTGKTLFGLSFPKIAIIDSEDGVAWYRDNPNLKKISVTSSAEDVEDALDYLEDVDTNEIQTFIVDSETKIYENLQFAALDVAERRARNKGQHIDDANISQREWGKIKLVNKRIQSSKILLASKGINVISVAQEKDVKQKQGDSWVTVGHEPDVAKGFAFDYDIILRFFTQEEDGDVRFFAKVIKDRTRTFKVGQIIENPTYEMWKPAFDKSKGGETVVRNMGKDAEKDTKKMVSELKQAEELIEEFKKLTTEKKLNADQKTTLKRKLAELGIDNPLNTTDCDGLEDLIEFLQLI